MGRGYGGGGAGLGFSYGVFWATGKTDATVFGGSIGGGVGEAEFGTVFNQGESSAGGGEAFGLLRFGAELSIYGYNTMSYALMLPEKNNEVLGLVFFILRKHQLLRRDSWLKL